MKTALTLMATTLCLAACDGAPPPDGSGETGTQGAALGAPDCQHELGKEAAPVPAAFGGEHCQPDAQKTAAAPGRTQIELGEAPLKGPANAPVTIVVYSDFQCPYCARGATRIDEIEKKYGERVRFAFKHLPLPFHPHAKEAAAATIAAQKQGQFWALHDRLFKNQQALDRDGLLAQAEALGLDRARFEADLDSAETLAAVEQDQAEAKRLGVNGTPTFFVNGVRLTGAQPLEAFQKLIDAEL